MSELVPHIPGLRRYARLLTGDRARADDLVQDTLERALRKLHLFDPARGGAVAHGAATPRPTGGGASAPTDDGRSAALRSWLLTVMHNLWASQRRGERPQDALAEQVDHPGGYSDGDSAGPGGVVLVDPASDPSVRTAVRLDTQRALASLPDPQRAVLLLVVVEELAYAKVAEVLGVPVGTVMSRLSRARAAMRQHLDAPANAVTNQRGSAAKNGPGSPGSAAAAGLPLIGASPGAREQDAAEQDAAGDAPGTGTRLRVVGGSYSRSR
ncbi:MAG: hypothetical protein RIQ60_3401 [Pseudomonadota bacterium]